MIGEMCDITQLSINNNLDGLELKEISASVMYTAL